MNYHCMPPNRKMTVDVEGVDAYIFKTIEKNINNIKLVRKLSRVLQIRNST